MCECKQTTKKCGICNVNLCEGFKLSKESRAVIMTFCSSAIASESHCKKCYETKIVSVAFDTRKLKGNYSRDNYNDEADDY